MMEIFRTELYPNRRIFYVLRDENNPKIIEAKVKRIVQSSSGDRHYLLVQGEYEQYKIVISGTIIPDIILTNSIFFTSEDANEALAIFKIQTRALKARPRF